MSKLILERFKCVEESDEIGADSPYFLIYVADSKNGIVKSDVKFVRRESWDEEVETGDHVTANITVSDGMRHDLVIVAMLEEDSDPDFGSPMNVILAMQMKKFDETLKAVSTGIDDNLAEVIRAGFKSLIIKTLGNDEILGVKRLSKSSPTLRFTGDESDYRVTFKFV